jgi:very-short-patch-repair endonuclease
MSPPEARLWSRLRKRVPGQPVFRRQHPVGPYVLDFYCASARLAIELDGLSHDMGDHPQRDKSHGIEVVRVAVRDLPRNIDDLADSILQMASEKR